LNKDLLLSTTFAGAVVSLVSFILMFFKIDISNEEVTQIVTGILAVIGTVMVIVGRLKAKTEITSIGGVKIR
jgi:heme/copper-type cytochrome/quinol oxidase subunit 4